MNIEDLEEDLKDIAMETIAVNYHRLNPPGVRLFLDGLALETIVSAAVAAFMIPYLKILGEKAASKTWDAITKKEGSKDSVQPEKAIDPFQEKKFTEEDLKRVHEMGKAVVFQVLLENKLTESDSMKVFMSLSAKMDSVISIGETGKQPKRESL